MKKMGKTNCGLLALMILTAACSGIKESPTDGPENASTVQAVSVIDGADDERSESQLAQSIRVGDNGPRFPACAYLGHVSGVGQHDLLDVYGAPFECANVIDNLANGRELYVCSNSMDRKWFGVVYAGKGQSSSECGLDAPIRLAREYAGPCKSGWVSSAFVRP